MLQCSLVLKEPAKNIGFLHIYYFERQPDTGLKIYVPILIVAFCVVFSMLENNNFLLKK